MSATQSLGEVAALGKALGLLNGDGEFNSAWLSRPGDYLSTILAEETQRNALIEFIDDALGGAERETDSDGLVWLPIAEHNNPRVSIYVVLDPQPENYVAIGVGARLNTTGPESRTEIHVPVFRAAKTGKTVLNALLIGTAQALVRLSVEITLGSAPPLGGIGLALRVPTGGAVAPRVSLQLKRLQLPGASTPRDLEISVSSLDELDDAILELVFGLVRAQADSLPAGPLSALAGMLGLRGAGVPALPLDRLKTEGVSALANWFEQVVSVPAARTAWLQQLAALLSASAAGDEISFNLPPARVRIGMVVVPGAAGRPVVTPTLSVDLTSGDVRLQASAQLLRLDTGSSAVVALPAFEVSAQLGKRADGGNRILTGDPQIDAIRVGFALNEARRPVFVLAAENVRIAGHDYPVLDLSSPDALAETAGTVLGDVASALLDALGPVSAPLKLLLGLDAPAGVPKLNIAAFLQNPLDAVRGHWQAVLRDHPEVVAQLLTTLRDLIADAGAGAIAVTGAGTSSDPWRVPLVGPVQLIAWRMPGDVLEIGVVAQYMNDQLGQRCTRLDAELAIGLASLDLATSAASFFTSVTARLTARGRGASQAAIQLGPLELTADHVGISFGWRPNRGLRVNVLAPNAALGGVALPIPVFGDDGSVTLDEAAWSALERLFALLASLTPAAWIQDLIGALGWAIPVGVEKPRLRLADLAVNPEAALRVWLTDLAIDDGGAVAHIVQTIGRALTGTSAAYGRFAGSGTLEDPYRTPLLPAATSPEMAFWLLPAGPQPMYTKAPEALQSWLPGKPGLPVWTLAQAVESDDPALGADRGTLAQGLDTLVRRWTATDGRIVAPPVAPPSITVTRVADQTAGELTADLAEVFETEPETTIYVRVGEWPVAPAGRLIDLRAPGLAPEAFPIPAVATGEWFVALGSRADSRLASGDADGVLGQTQRLTRALSGFAGVAGQVVIVARETAGHPALNAANSLAFVDGVVMLGTALSPVAFTIVDDAAAGDALRLLNWLLPPADDAEPDDADLARGRELVTGLLALGAMAEPERELQPPAVLTTPRAELAAHAIYGVLEEASILRALTAIVTAGLSRRAMERAAAARPKANAACLGLRSQIRVGETGIVLRGHVTAELFRASAAGLAESPAIHMRVEIRRAGGWLLGGAGRGSTNELRWLEARVSVPLSGGSPATAELTLHESSIFGIAREIRRVDPESPALPEVRALLGMAAEQIAAAEASSAEIAAFVQLLTGLELLSETGGTLPDAIDHFVHDTGEHIRAALDNATRGARLAGALPTLLAAIPPGLSIDLAARSLIYDAASVPGDRGLFPWTTRVELRASGSVSARFTLGSAGTSVSGGAVLRAENAPLRLTLDWHKPGGAVEAVRLWPSPDAAAMGRSLARLAPAELARLVFEQLRNLDETAKPLIDAVLDAIALLDAQGRVRLPLALLEDPAGWLRHPQSIAMDGAKAAALLNALKPILGIGGAPGEWDLAPGVKAMAGAANGNLRLGFSLQAGGIADRLTLGGTFWLELPPGAGPRPSIEAFVGLSGAATGRRAVHVEAGIAGIRVFLRPDASADLPLYPTGPGLGQLAETAVTQALPLVLDALAAQNGANLAGRAGAIVRAVGDALALRTGAPLKFDGARLRAWAADPAEALVDALPSLSSAALSAIAGALGPAMPAGASVTVADGAVTATANSVSVTWRPTPFEIGVSGTITGIPAVERVKVAIVFDNLGLKSLAAQVGPGSIDAGGVILRPLAGAVVGRSPAGGRRIDVGLATNIAGDRRIVGRWNLDGAGLSLTAVDGAAESTTPEQVALALLDAVVNLAASFAVRQPPVTQLLNRPVGGTTVREILKGVLLNPANGTAIDTDLFVPQLLLARLQRLALNLAGANPSVNIGGGLSIGLAKSGSLLQFVLGVNGRIQLFSGAVTLSMEADSRWIKDQPPAGLTLTVLDTAGGAFTFAPGLSANGIGFRISKPNGPLLDVGLSLGSVAVHVFGQVKPNGELSGGVQLQLSELAVAARGAQGGNPIAQGMLSDTGSGPNALQPAFSPALAVQKHGAGPVLVSLRAGDGAGPWWLAIQRGFGPLYIEQVGFGVTVRQDQLERISILLDGRVSLFGMTAAVDDLQLTFVVASNASLFDPGRWAVDLAGLAISADMAGLTLAGGLRKFGSGDNVEYIGMLLARFGVYGISVYGGYGTGMVNGARFSSFFAFGALVGPIGGPPAFFLTGIGGGLGINRDLKFPTDMSRFGEFPFLEALDPGAPAVSDPMRKLEEMRQYFPMKAGDFWFAAGISFNSFALVDAVAVVSVKVGDGLEIALLGLARMALPRPQFALVSIELALIARFSTKEGVLWIQAQLTDNSWLLHESVRLTGGFAFVTWFKGDKKGQFVLTLGGYHPDFHRDGYPEVPRLGYRWSLGSAISIEGTSYFALTSEALMAGTDTQASARFGPAWAEVAFGAHGIVYFDPFWFDVSAYARISAGVTIDLWLGEITISVTLGARLRVTGPKIHGEATFEVGPIELTFEFGEKSPPAKIPLSWPQFAEKYLEVSSPGIARVLTAVPGKGSLPPGTDAGGSEKGTADGSAAKPFEVYSEFEITVTSTVPSEKLSIAGVVSNHPPSRQLGLGPMKVPVAQTMLELHLRNAGGQEKLGALPAPQVSKGAFPIGVWGPPQPEEDPKLPKGDVVEAVDSLRFEAQAAFSGTLPGQVKYHQVEIALDGKRKPLPFVNAKKHRPQFLTDAQQLTNLLPNVAGAPATYDAAKPWLLTGGNSRTAIAALQGERSAPPRLGSLTQGLAAGEMAGAPVKLQDAKRPPAPSYRVKPPKAIAILTAPVLPERAPVKTTVPTTQAVTRIAPPTLAEVTARLPLAVSAKLLRLAPSGGAVQGGAILPVGAAPLTRNAAGATAAVASRSAAPDAKARLASITGNFVPAERRATVRPEVLRAGEVAVLQMPNAIRDVSESDRPRLIARGQSRLVALAHGGAVLADQSLSRLGVEIPRGTERIAVIAGGEGEGLAGWHSGQEVAYVGWATAIVPGGVMTAEGARPDTLPQRYRSGWVAAAELIAESTIVRTRFFEPVRTVAIVLDDAQGASQGRNLSMVLEGASRLQVAGRDEAPTVVAIGNRTILVYAVEPEKNRAVTVGVAREQGWYLGGVLGSTGVPSAVVQRLLERDLDRALRPMVAGRGGSVMLSWTEPEDRKPIDLPDGKRRTAKPAKKAAPKKKGK